MYKIDDFFIFIKTHEVLNKIITIIHLIKLNFILYIGYLINITIFVAHNKKHSKI